jgi:hypothetical protein
MQNLTPNGLDDSRRPTVPCRTTAPQVSATEIEEPPEAALLDHERSVRIGLAEIEVGAERQLPGRQRTLQPNHNIQIRGIIGNLSNTDDSTIGANDGQFSNLDEMRRNPFQ